MKDSATFEQQIHRIHELLEGFEAEVTWNDHVTDPDNPPQQRQVDITVKKDGKVTHIECRDHQAPQDVQWIEELIGRRTSLGADVIVAVSSSGFTAGALKKAQRYDIIARDLRDLTDLEITSWGRRVALTIYFYQYSDMELTLFFGPESIPKLNVEVVKSEFTLYQGIQSVFNAAARYLTTHNLLSEERIGREFTFNLGLEQPGLQLSGESVARINVQGKVRLLSNEVNATAAIAYGKADDNSLYREAVVEVFPQGRTSIVHDGSRISVLLDISQVELPPLCQFRFFKLVGQGEVDHESLEIIGHEKLRVHGSVKINICSL
jgi:hypothetical protein